MSIKSVAGQKLQCDFGVIQVAARLCPGVQSLQCAGKHCLISPVFFPKGPFTSWWESCQCLLCSQHSHCCSPVVLHSGGTNSLIAQHCLFLFFSLGVSSSELITQLSFSPLQPQQSSDGMPDFNYTQEGFLPMSQVRRSTTSQLFYKLDGWTESVLWKNLAN